MKKLVAIRFTDEESTCLVTLATGLGWTKTKVLSWLVTNLTVEDIQSLLGEEEAIQPEAVVSTCVYTKPVPGRRVAAVQKEEPVRVAVNRGGTTLEYEPGQTPGQRKFSLGRRR